MGKLISAEFDSNENGQLDTHYEYDKYEKIQQLEKGSIDKFPATLVQSRLDLKTPPTGNPQ